MNKAMGIIEIDVSSISSSEELHELLSSKLSFPGYYGRNWDAFWDCVRDPEQSIIPKQLFIRGWSKIESRLPRDAKLLRDCLEDLAGERPEVTIEWG
jgi:RNAse (barnase) inhibitor barstar